MDFLRKGRYEKGEKTNPFIISDSSDVAKRQIRKLISGEEFDEKKEKIEDDIRNFFP